MRIKEIFEVVELESVSVLVPVGDPDFHGIVKLNSSAAFIVGCLADDTTYEEILEKMKNKYDAPEATLAQALEKMLGQLREIGALNE